MNFLFFIIVLFFTNMSLAMDPGTPQPQDPNSGNQPRVSWYVRGYGATRDAVNGAGNVLRSFVESANPNYSVSGQTPPATPQVTQQPQEMPIFPNPSTNAAAIVQTIAQQGGAILGTAATGVYNGAAQNLQTNINQQLVDGFAEALKKTFEVDAQGRPTGKMAQALDNAVKMLKAQLQNDGEVKKVIDASMKVLADQFNDSGEGARLSRQAFEKFAKDLGTAMETVGQSGNTTINNLLTNLANQAADGGELARMSREAFENVSEDAKNAMSKLSEEAREELKRLGETSLDITKQFNDEGIRFVREGLYNNYAKGAIVTGAVCISIITAYYGSKVLWNHIDRNLKKPRLIIDSSKKSILQRLKSWIFKEKYKPEQMIFDDELAADLKNIVDVTRTVNNKIKSGNNNVKYRNLLLWGAPGTGKTMFARILARSSGMEFVEVSGASFAKFIDKGEGIQAMDELFAWAKNSKNGLLIFIDECEAFLSERKGMKTTEESYQALTNFLNHTGTRSSKFMIVFATNHPKVLDTAMERRIDDAIEMKLPKPAERVQCLNLYRDKYMLNEKQNDKEFMESVKTILDGRKIIDIATKTEGLSYGDLEGIINIIKTDADATITGLLTEKLVDRAVEKAIKKHSEFLQNFKPTMDVTGNIIPAKA
ncbi:AAA family ATPase [Candidatus Dependentiae bacterium]|nr:AAA family ATPase [Candidatus Dependentiae bacterium]